MWNWRRYTPRENRPTGQLVTRFGPQRLLTGERIALASAAVAFSSFLVATAALYLTFNAQLTDKEYRELLVRPQLKSYLDTGNFKIVIENVGPGHAEIVAVFIFNKEKCIRIDSETPQQIATLLIDGHEARVSNTLKKTLEEYYKRAKKPIPHALQTRSLHVGDFVPPGKVFALFELQPGFKEELEKYNLWLSAKEEFEANVETGITFRFCSASRRYCRYLVSEDSDRVCKSLMPLNLPGKTDGYLAN